MARVKGRPKQIESTPNWHNNIPDEQSLASAILVGGMNTSVDKADIPNEQLTLSVNTYHRNGKVGKRFGTSTFLPAAPNANPVLLLFDHYPNTDSILRFRFTKAGGHYTEGTTWTALTGALTGSDIDKIRVCVVLDNIIIGQGVDRLKKVNLNNNTLADLGTNAPRAKYFVGFADRVVAANIGNDPNSASTVVWSGNRNFTVFDTVEDISSGQKIIIDSSTNKLDPISGLIALSSVLVLPREQSIALATKQTIASNPFNFFTAVPGIGTSLPGSIAIGKDGIIFVDSRQKSVYHYIPGGQPENIGSPIENTILENIDDPRKIFSAYYKHQDEYMVGIKQSGSSTVRVWVFNFRTKSWSYHEYTDISTLYIADIWSNYTSFDQLAGTFDALTGTFDELSASPKKTETPVIGKTNGTIFVEDQIVATDNAVAYLLDIRSKEFKQNRDDLIITKFMIEYQGQSSGSLIFLYSKDGGASWITGKTVNFVASAGTKLLKFTKQIKTRRIMWRITSNSGLIDIVNYEVIVNGSGESRS